MSGAGDHGDLTRISDLFGNILTPKQNIALKRQIAKTKRAKALTVQHERRIRAGEEILATPATIDDAAYMPSILCHLGMPRSQVASRSYEQTYVTPHFAASLRMDAGALWTGKGWTEQPLPYGIKPRLILLTIFTAAKKQRTRSIDAGRSTREFMLRAGIDPQGNQYRSFSRQMSALAACDFRMGRTYGDGRLHTTKGTIIKDFQAWLIPDATRQQVLWPGVIELSQEMYDSLQDSLVPMDERAVARLNGALEADIYFWLSQRLCRIEKRDGQFITWNALKDQFAPTSYGTVKKFKQEFVGALKQVCELYRDARIDPARDPNGLWLHPSKPPIPKALMQVKGRTALSTNG